MFINIALNYWCFLLIVCKDRCSGACFVAKTSLIDFCDARMSDIALDEKRKFI